MMGEFTTLQDGTIDNSSPYVYWHPDAETAVLDGDFTAAQLRAIAEHMERHQVKETT